jgi:Sec-independent protein translocase protein TatA
MNLHKKDNPFSFQIKELQQYINHLDEKIRRYEKQNRNPSRLKDNKAKARETIEQLKQAQKSNTTPLHPKR